MTKKELRAQIRGRISRLSQDYKNESSRKISELVLACGKYKAAKSIFVYFSTADEPDTAEIIEAALKQGKAVYVPKCLEKGLMVPVRISEDTQYETCYMGIKEPLSYDENIALTEIDLCIIPCMSAAPDGRRLGHGAGFYDIFLSKTKTYKLCLCFNALICENIPTDELDVKMDAVVTESGFFTA